MEWFARPGGDPPPGVWYLEEGTVPGHIVIVGLGPGDPALITLQAWESLQAASTLYLRTRRHPTVAALPPGLVCIDFDAVYDQAPDFSSVYQTIANRLLEEARSGHDVIYAVPGDPSFGEASVQTLRSLAQAAEVEVRVMPGVSFVEPSLALLGVDALDGLFICDALELAAAHHPPFPPDRPALIGQLHSILVATDVKLSLMNQYPDTHPVQLVHDAGTSSEWIERVPLHDIDRSSALGLRSSLLVPPLDPGTSFEAFQEMVAHLRATEGCPWDREQTHQSLRPHVLEEAYEVLQALDADDMQALREELGDLLLQIVLQAQIATEGGEFCMADVVSGIHAKILRRHPHVFHGLEVENVEEVLQNWETLKAAEREEHRTGQGLLGGVPSHLPALAQAHELQGRAHRVGFDWPDLEGVQAKLAEELTEVLQAVETPELAAEVGDMLFAAVNYARWLDVEPEVALREANQRFRERFGAMERAAAARGLILRELSPQAWDRLWEEAKSSRGGSTGQASSDG
jgi:tetrapyrrole methylase family protein/MazG family protein